GTRGGPLPAISTSVSIRSCHNRSRRTSETAIVGCPISRGGGGQRGGGTFCAQTLRPPTVLVLVPKRREMRQHLAREQADVALAQIGRHRAEMQERQQVPSA